MTKLSIVSGQRMVEYNLYTLYHLPQKYESIHYFLNMGTLKKTLYAILNFIKDKQCIMYKHRYTFIIDTSTLCSLRHTFKHLSWGRASSNRHFNLLCCTGLLNKVYQNKGRGELLEVNKHFLETTKKRRPINVFSIRAYTEDELDRIESRCKRLRQANVRIGSISYNYLELNGLEDIADEVYFVNDRNSPYRKELEGIELLQVMDWLTEDNGYTTKDEIKNQLVYADAEIENLFRIFNSIISERYHYGPPTKEQRLFWNLPDRKYLYTRKDNEGNAET